MLKKTKKLFKNSLGKIHHKSGFFKLQIKLFIRNFSLYGSPAKPAGPEENTKKFFFTENPLKKYKKTPYYLSVRNKPKKETPEDLWQKNADCF